MSKVEIKFFNQFELNSILDLKSAFRTLIKTNHPDVGGKESDMKQINAEYDYLFNNVHELDLAKMTDEQKKKDFHSINDNYREIIVKVAFIDGLVIDLVGSWVWVGGNTFANADTFRINNFKFSKSKRKWYWYNGIENEVKRKFRPQYKTYDDVKKAHGYTSINTDDARQKQLSTAC